MVGGEFDERGFDPPVPGDDERRGEETEKGNVEEVAIDSGETKVATAMASVAAAAAAGGGGLRMRGRGRERERRGW
jgi:hypothetical protein